MYDGGGDEETAGGGGGEGGGGGGLAPKNKNPTQRYRELSTTLI